jgi:hypothetical protein
MIFAWAAVRSVIMHRPRLAMKALHQLFMMLPQPRAELGTRSGRQRRFDTMVRVLDCCPERIGSLLGGRADLRVQAVEKCADVSFLGG